MSAAEQRTHTVRKAGIQRKVAAIIFFAVLIIMTIAIGLVFLTGYNLVSSAIGREYIQITHALGVYINKALAGEVEDAETYAARPLWIDKVKESNLKYSKMSQKDVQSYMRDMDKKWSESDKTSSLVREYTESRIGISIKDIFKIRGNIEELFVADRCGGLVAASGKTRDFYQADEEWWKAAFNSGKGNLYVGDIEYDRSSKCWIIPIAVPMRDENNAVIGVCKVSVSISRLFAYLEDVKIGRTGHTVLVDRNCNIIYHPEMPPMSMQYGCEIDNKRKQGQGGFFISRHPHIHKKDIFSAFSVVMPDLLAKKGIYWYVFIDQDADETFEPLNKFDFFLVVIAVIVMIITVPIGFLFGRLFVKPIRELHLATEKVIEGDWSYKIDIRTGDEIEQFADAFKMMTSTIKDKQIELLNANKQLEGLSKSLEKKVEERTKDLVDAQVATLNILEDLQASKDIIAASKFKMESMVRSMAEGVIMLDTGGDIIVINPQARWMLGLELHKEIMPDLLYDTLKALKLYDSLEKCRTVSDCVTKEISGPQNRFLLSEMTQVKDDRGSIIGIAIIVRDITKEKEIGRAKTEFVSIVSHELRTPLSIIKEGINLVLDKILGSINEKQEKVLNTSRENIDRLAKIIDELLDISKIESGKMELKKQMSDINDIIRKTAASFEPKIRAAGLELKLSLPPDKIECNVDTDKIVQVLTNLIGNSIKFTSRGYVEVSCRDKGNEVEIAVVDTGSGIAPVDMPKVFGKFQQFGRIGGAGEKGTGLGLSIAKGIVDMHRGKIWTESEPNVRTAFIFTLPK